MKRVMCVRFPNWPVQRRQAASPERRQSPLVLYRDFGQRGQRVAFCCSLARRAGVEPGLTVAETKALLDVAARRPAGALILEDDPAGDREALRELAVICQRYSPAVGVDDLPEPDSLLFDLTGCGHLFGGEEQLAQHLRRDLERRSYHVHIAIAGTVGAAWGTAHFAIRHHRTRIIPRDGHVNFLPALPVEALRLSAETVATLHELDIRRIAQLQAIPRSTLPSRLGTDIIRRLDQAFGHLPEVITPVIPDEPLTVEREFDPPISDRRGVSVAVGRLLNRLLKQLADRNHGAIRLQVRLRYEQAGHSDFLIATKQPSCSPGRWQDLFDLQLERTPLAADVERMQLTVLAKAPLDSRQSEFFESDATASDRQELTRLLERLSSRLGDERVVRPRLLPEEQPELAVAWKPVLATSPIDADGNQPAGTRPLHLEQQPMAVDVMSVIPDGPPIRIFWQSRPHTLPRCWGPERIETGWWRERHIRRDYYRAETDDGRHLWLFRNADGAWFLHGVFE